MFRGDHVVLRLAQLWRLANVIHLKSDKADVER